MLPRFDFTKEQREQLTELSLISEQVDELRYTLLSIAIIQHPQGTSAKGDKILGEVMKHADALLAVLRSASPKSKDAHAEALARIERNYGRAQRRADNGKACVDDVIIRLAALSQAAHKAAERRSPRKQRFRTASPEPIREIDDALHRGWYRAHPARSGFAATKETRYPEKFRPDEAEDSTFREIVRICYEAAGAKNTDPLRAIRAYVTPERKRFKQLAAAMYPAARGKKTGTH